MKRRHAAGIALLAWYLMVPPSDDSRALSDSPLAEWRRFEPFESSTECNASLAEQRRDESERMITNSKEIVVFFYAKCIASDDPRLAQ